MKLKIDLEELEEAIALNADCESADYLLNQYFFTLSPAERKVIKKMISDGISPDDAYRLNVLKKMSEDDREVYALLQQGYGLDGFKRLDASSYLANPYYLALKGLEGKKVGDWEFAFDSISAYEPFVYLDTSASPVFPTIRINPVGYFETDFPYPKLSNKGTPYMSLVPHEIETMRKPIQESHGTVMTFGLGLGYFTYMASSKEEVDKVIVVEKDDNVISLFKKVFLPLFPHKEKVEIVRADALSYTPKEEIDYLFVDLYHTAEDGLPMYLRLCKTALAKKTDFWIEGAILEYLRRHVYALLEEEAQGYGDDDYDLLDEDFSAATLAALHFHLKNREIDDINDVAMLTSDSSLRQIAKELEIK